MASLTHVCMWSDNGWKRVSVKEAIRSHPGGTVSAHSGLFMCELCGQYVTLTDGNIRVRYFKHSAYEKSKDCPERTYGAGYSSVYSAEEHELPIRIIGVSSTSFRFEVGLIRVPISALNKDLRIEIKPKGAWDISFVFSRERLNYDSITYLPVGEKPYEIYTLKLQNGNDELKAFWPSEIKGIDPEGTLFEKETGTMLSNDADVEIGKEYYLLKRGHLYLSNSKSGLKIQEVTKKKFSWETWSLYTVTALEFNQYAASFFLDFHCRLTEHPVSIQPIWPLFVEGGFVTKHNHQSIYIIIHGNISTVRTFPIIKNPHLLYSENQFKLYEFLCSNRQQLISVGRTNALKYKYFWRETLDQEGIAPQLAITDLSGNEVCSGETDSLPQGKTLRISTTFDGELITSKNDHVVDKRKISADKYIELDNLAYGQSVQLIVGLDCVWKIQFMKRQNRDLTNENILINLMANTSGVLMSAPHSLRNILVGMNRYPRICQWIRICIKEGVINEQSYRRLQEAYRNMKLYLQGGDL